MEDPSYGRKRTPKTCDDLHGDNKSHVIGTVGAGYIIGLEEAVHGKQQIHNTSVICHSQKLKVYVVDTEIFVQRMMTQKAAWKNLVQKSTSIIQKIA